MVLIGLGGVLAVMFVISISPKSPDKDGGDPQLDAIRAKVRAEELVRDTLKDPASAEFSDELIRSVKDPLVVCGFVNAKNSFGGFVGKSPFVVDAHGIYVWQGNSREFRAAWARSCDSHVASPKARHGAHRRARPSSSADEPSSTEPPAPAVVTAEPVIVSPIGRGPGEGEAPH